MPKDGKRNEGKISKSLLRDFDNSRFLRICFFIIFVCVSYLIFFGPYMGIANNGDFQRFSQKIGVFYPFDPWAPENYKASFFFFITNNFVIANPTPTGFFSSYELVGWLSRGIAAIFSKSGGSYDIRYIGAACLICYSAACGLLLYAVKNLGKFTAAAAGIFAVILSLDPYMVQYFNSFYSEMGIILSLLTFFASFLLFMQNGKIPWLVLQGISAIFAATSKLQNILVIVPLIILICIEIYLKYFQKFRIGKLKFAAVGCILTCLISSVTFFGVLRTNQGSTNLTACNVIFHDMLSVSQNPTERLQELELPQEEIPQLTGMIGYNLCEKRVSDYFNSHSQIFQKFTRSAELKLLIHEPSIGFRLIKNKAYSLFQDTTYGNFMAGSGLASQKCRAFPLNRKLKSVLLFSNIYFYMAVLLLGLLVPYIQYKKSHKLSNLHLLLPCLAICDFLQFLCAAFGDGNEDIKHFFAVNIEFEVVYILLIASIVKIIFEIHTSIRSREKKA